MEENLEERKEERSRGTYENEAWLVKEVACLLPRLPATLPSAFIVKSWAHPVGKQTRGAHNGSIAGEVEGKMFREGGCHWSSWVW